jgi:hypothetical protein
VLPADTSTGEVSVAANAARSCSSDSNSFLQKAPYRAAATNDAIRVALAGMMTVLATVWNSNGSKHALKVSLDSGCNGSCISAELLAQQWHQFFGPGSTAELQMHQQTATDAPTELPGHGWGWDWGCGEPPRAADMLAGKASPVETHVLQHLPEQ